MEQNKSHRPDRRTRRTQRMLKQAFLDLLEQKPIEKITVAEISRVTDIGRGTFYTHYRDVYDIYDVIVDDTINELTTIFEKRYPKSGENNFNPLVTHFVNYVEEHRRLFDALTFHGDNVKVLKKFADLFAYQIINVEDFENSDIKKIEFVHFASYGLVGSLVDWLTTESHSELADFTQVLSLSIESVITNVRNCGFMDI